MELQNSAVQAVQLIVLAVIGLGVPTLTVALIKWVQAHAAEVRANFSLAQNALIDQFVAIAVQAVEQAHLKEQLYATGEEMLAAAVEIVQVFLDSHGLGEINVSELEARIRAAILEGVNKPADSTAPTLTPTVTEPSVTPPSV